MITWLIRRRSPGIVNRVFRRLSSSPAASSRSRMARTTRRRRWGSSRSRSSPAASRAGRRPPFWVIMSAAPRWARHLRRRLADHQDARTRIAKLDPPQGFAAQTACASILWRLRTTAFPSRRRTRSPAASWARAPRAAVGGALGRRREHRDRVDHDDPLCCCRGAADGARDPASGRRPIVFVLAAPIAWTAFAARRWQTRRLATAPA